MQSASSVLCVIELAGEFESSPADMAIFKLHGSHGWHILFLPSSRVLIVLGPPSFCASALAPARMIVRKVHGSKCLCIVRGVETLPPVGGKVQQRSAIAAAWAVSLLELNLASTEHSCSSHIKDMSIQKSVGEFIAVFFIILPK